MHRRIASACLLLTACGSEPTEPTRSFEEACASVPGCEAPAEAIEGPPMAIWRVLVLRGPGGALSIREVEEIDVPALLGPPQGALFGTHGLAALDEAGAPLELQLLRFADTLVLEEGDLEYESIDLSNATTSAVGYLRVHAEVRSLAVVEPDGTVVSSSPAPAPGQARKSLSSPPGALTPAAPLSGCSHVMLLEGLDDIAWYPHDYPLREVTPTQRALIRSAFNQMTPMHCAGVSRVALVDMGESNARVGGSVTRVRGGYTGDLVLINATLDVDEVRFDENALTQLPFARALFQHTVVHESAHATTFLLDALAEASEFEGEWTPTGRARGLELIDRTRLRGGFTPLWERVHTSFIARGWAEPYYDLGLATLNDAIRQRYRGATPAQLAEAGMMSAYAGASLIEDIAETATWPILGAIYAQAEAQEGPAPLKNDFGCLAMQAYREPNVPTRLAAIFTKLTFLRDAGIVSETNHARCIGDQLGLPDQPPGIVVYQDGEVQRQFTSGPTAGIGTRDGRYVFTMEVGGTAEFGGEEYGAVLDLELDLGPTTDANQRLIPLERVSWPRGSFVISPATRHAFRLRMVDAPAGNFDVTDGFALVPEATNQRIAGSVVVTEAFRFQAPIPVPQNFDPPVQFRFLLSK